MLFKWLFMLCCLGSSWQKLLILDSSTANDSGARKFGDLWIATSNFTGDSAGVSVENEMFSVFQHSAEVLQNSPPNWVSFLLTAGTGQNRSAI